VLSSTSTNFWITKYQCLNATQECLVLKMMNLKMIDRMPVGKLTLIGSGQGMWIWLWMARARCFCID